MAARYYDGVTADVQEVMLKITAQELLICRPADSAVVARWPVADMLVLGDSHHEAVPPLALSGSDARLIVEDPAWRAQLVSLVPALKPLALEPVRVAPRLGAYSLAIVALVGLFWSAVEYGTEYAVPLLPYALQARLGETVLDELLADKEICDGRAGLAAINRLANDLAREASYKHEVTVHIVKGGPVNAFTLPGSILIFYSDLIEQAKDSSQVAGVLAHEIGHVAYRHTTRMLVQQGVLQMGLELALGDVSGLLASGSALLTAMSYSRAHEREADCFALGLMRRAALPTAPMGDLLLAMAQDARSGGKDPQPGKAQEPGQDEAHPVWSLLSSHPDTAGRARALRAGQAPGCS